MQLKRVVITGMGAVSPYGNGVPALLDGLWSGKSSIQVVDAFTRVEGLRCHLGGLAHGVDPQEIPRKDRRSMSAMSVYAFFAAREALHMGNVDPAMHSSGRLGVAIGSTIGSPNTMQSFFEDFLRDRCLERARSTLFFQIMNHSCSSNVAHALKINGRVLASSSACATGCQTIGYGMETIALGKQDMMLCGGADEFHLLVAGTFDKINAASFGFNDRPTESPRPFDADRDGVVCGEGAGVLLLESLESARDRGAAILAEVAGFGTNHDPSSIANPDAAAIEACMRQAIEDAGIAPKDVDYVNAHATATRQGDIAECAAVAGLLGARTPMTSLKGHMGHTLAASGALESIAVIDMMRKDTIIPTLNLDTPDPLCQGVDLPNQPVARPLRIALKNNFALGGVNSSIVLRRYEHD